MSVFRTFPTTCVLATLGGVCCLCSVNPLEEGNYRTKSLMRDVSLF